MCFGVACLLANHCVGIFIRTPEFTYMYKYTCTSIGHVIAEVKLWFSPKKKSTQISGQSDQHFEDAKNLFS